MPNIGFWAIAGAGGGADGLNPTLISTQILSSTATSITFSSIPSTYKHLQIRVAAKATSDGSAAITYQFNGDSGSNYFWQYLATNGTSLTAYAVSPAQPHIRSTLYYWGMSSTFPTTQIGEILDYANTNKYKTLRLLSGQAGSSASELGLHSGIWQNTSAINSITINCTTAAIGSRFSLYGVN